MDVTDASQLFYLLGNTEHVVPWSRLREATAGEPLTQRGRCELLLRAVNGDRLPATEWNRLVGAQLVVGLNAGTYPMPASEAAALKGALSRVVEDPATAISVMGRNIAEIRNGRVLTLPAITVNGRAWELSEHVLAESAPSALIYALSLFVDPTKPFGKRLRQCAYAECGRFAFVGQPTGPGQPPNHFCNAEHRKQFNRAESLVRMHQMRAKRAGLSVAQYRARQARNKK